MVSPPTTTGRLAMDSQPSDWISCQSKKSSAIASIESAV